MALCFLVGQLGQENGNPHSQIAHALTVTPTVKRVQFFDCGANLETITCPQCRADVDFDWWGETMSSDYDEKSGFQLNEYRLPCCSTSASLDELIYAFQQSFGRFALSAMNPNIGKMSDDAVSEIEAILGCDVSIVYQHI